MAAHRGVGGRDDEERQQVQKDEGEQVDVLPVDVRGLREVGDAQAALLPPGGGGGAEPSTTRVVIRVL